MEQLILQLGIGGAVIWVLNNHLHRTSLRDKENDKRIDTRDQAFVKFVSEHNDKMTELVVQSTEAIKESTTAIKNASTLICAVSKAINKNNE